MISRYTRCLLLVNPIVYHKSNLWGEESKTTDAYIKESSTYVKYFMRIPILRSSLQYSDRSSKNSIYSNSTHMGLFYGLLQYFSSRYICISCIAEQKRSSISKYLVYILRQHQKQHISSNVYAVFYGSILTLLPRNIYFMLKHKQQKIKKVNILQ